MRALAWRNWLVATAAAALACGGGLAACGGDDSSGGTTQSGGDGGADVTSGGDDGSTGDATSGNDASDDSSNDATTGNDAAADSAPADSGGGSDASDGGAGDASDGGGGGDAGEGGAASCGDAGAACTYTNDAGAEKGLCSAASACAPCNDPGDDSKCNAAYGGDGGASYICVSGVCSPGNCHDSSTCSGQVCLNHTCQPCTTDSQCGANKVCVLTADAGAAVGTCASNACATPNVACSVNSNDICCPVSGNDVCLAGNCCTNSQCGSTPATPACTGNKCTACDAPANGLIYVDPVNGSDTVGSGSGTAGGVANSVCAFKTVTKAIAALGNSPVAGSKIVVVGVSGSSTSLAATETFPLTIPLNTTLTSMTGPILMTIPASTEGFRLVHPASGIASGTGALITIDGTATTALHGVVVGTGADPTTFISGIEVRNFADAGIRVQDTGKVNITAGTNVHGNGNPGTGTARAGLHVTGSGSALIGPIAPATPSANDAPIQFSSNSAQGILVDNLATVTINAVTTGMGTGTVVTGSNGTAGVFIAQVPPNGSAAPANTITGLVSLKNTTAGATIEGGSHAIVRKSQFLGNLYGINIPTNSTLSNAGDDTSGIDLGTDTSANAGLNVLQWPATVDAGVTGLNNAAIGVCYSINPNKSQHLYAVGNTWANGTGTASVDCSQSSSSTVTLTRAASCAGGFDLGGSGVQSGGGPSSNIMGLAYCQ